MIIQWYKWMYVKFLAHISERNWIPCNLAPLQQNWYPWTSELYVTCTSSVLRWWLRNHQTFLKRLTILSRWLFLTKKHPFRPPWNPSPSLQRLLVEVLRPDSFAAVVGNSSSSSWCARYRLSSSAGEFLEMEEKIAPTSNCYLLLPSCWIILELKLQAEETSKRNEFSTSTWPSWTSLIVDFGKDVHHLCLKAPGREWHRDV